MTWRSVSVGIAMVLGAASTMLLTAPAALACSCVAAQHSAQVAGSDVVFVGRVTERAKEPPRDVVGSIDPVTWTFTVDRVHKGAVREPQAVASVRSEASCGVEFEVGRTYLVLGDRLSDGVVSTGLCDGTRPVAAEPTSDVVEPRIEAAPSAAEPEQTGPPLAIALAVLAAVGVIGFAVWRPRRPPS